MSLYLLQARCEPRRLRPSVFVGEGLSCRFPVGLRGCNHVEGCVQLFAGPNEKLSLIMVFLGWRASHPPRGTPSGVHVIDDGVNSNLNRKGQLSLSCEV